MKIATLATSLLLAVVLAACDAKPTDTTQDGDKSPGSGAIQASLDLDRLRGQWVVINYWAKWCKPCLKEIPELNAFNTRYSQVTVLGVNYDGATGDELASQLAEFGMEFVSLTLDPSGQLGLPRPIVLPTTIIIDPAGQHSRTLVGPQTLASLAAATEQEIDNDE